LARSHVANADFEDVDFSPFQTTRELVSANLTETNWHGTSLKRTKLCKADFRGSKLVSDQADVTGADFSAVDLSEIKGFTQEQVNSAKVKRMLCARDVDPVAAPDPKGLARNAPRMDRPRMGERVF
jgi:hypothetical protein